jgi:hypothetical protein
MAFIHFGKNKTMYSVIALTMWKCKRFKETLIELSNNPLVGEIILIDNSEMNIDTLEIDKLNHIKEEKNTYINPAWNKGVSLAKYDKLLILNDDVWMDWGILEVLKDYITPDIGAIGLAGNSIDLEETGELSLVPVTHRYGNFGVAMFIHKKSWLPIPEEMKLWGGDDWIFVKNRNSGKPNFKVEGLKLFGEISGTLENEDLTPVLNPIKERDLELKNYYNLF